MKRKKIKRFSQEDLVKYTLLAILLLVIILAYSQFNRRSEEGFTQLYFNENLPHSIQAGDEFNVQFVIQNFEFDTMRYTYTISLDLDLLEEKTITLSKGEDVNLSSLVVFEDSGMHKLIIALNKIDAEDEKPLEIYFSVEVS